jgi:hypothetical protein
MLRTFQNEAIEAAESGQVQLYPGHHNQLAHTLVLSTADDYRMELQPIDMSGRSAGLPLTLRQPIEQGVGFFLYAEKYASLIEAVFDASSTDPEVRGFNRFYQQVVSKLSPYLTSLFRLSVLVYVDRLGYTGLLKFSLWLDHVLGAIRLEKAYIFQQAPLKFLKEPSLNLLDVLAFAYRSEEVIEHLSSQAKKSTAGRSSANNIYKNQDGWKSTIAKGNGVQGRYLLALAAYYDVTDMIDKHKRIKDKCAAELANV